MKRGGGVGLEGYNVAEGGGIHQLSSQISRQDDKSAETGIMNRDRDGEQRKRQKERDAKARSEHRKRELLPRSASEIWIKLQISIIVLVFLSNLLFLAE
jgi:hypothetical protein